MPSRFAKSDEAVPEAPKSRFESPAPSGTTPAIAPHPEQPSALQRFGNGMYDATVGSLMHAANDPIGTAGGILRSAVPIPSGEVLNSRSIPELVRSAASSNPLTAPLVPIVDKARQGDIAGAAGNVAGLGAMLAAPKVIGSASRAIGAPEAMAPAMRVLKSPDVMERAGNLIPLMKVGTRIRGLGNAVSEAWKGPPPPEAPRTPPPPPIAKPTPAPPLRFPKPGTYGSTQPAPAEAPAATPKPAAPQPEEPPQAPTIAKPSTAKPISIPAAKPSSASIAEQLRDAMAEGQEGKINDQGVFEAGPDYDKYRQDLLTDEGNLRKYLDSQKSKGAKKK